MSRQRVLSTIAALLAVAAPVAAQEAVSLSLADAVRRAVVNAPAVRLASSREEQAEALLRQTRAGLLPALDLGVSWSNRSYNQASMGRAFPNLPGTPPPSDRIGPYDLWDTRLSVSQPLFDAVTRLAVHAARRGTEVSEAARFAEQEAAAARAALAYSDAVRARSVLDARVADLDLASELVRLARERLDAGVGTPLDVTRAETQRLALEGDSLVAARIASAAEIELARVMGLEPTTRFLFPASAAPPGPVEAVPDPESAVRRALQNRPELRMEDALRLGHEASRRAIEAERLPRVDLFGDIGWSGTSADNVIPTRQLGLRVAVPFLDGWRREGRIAEQRALANQVAIRERDLRGSIEAEVRIALLERASVGDLRRVAAERLRLAELELEQTRALFVEGSTGSAEVVDAQRGLVAARDAIVAAEHQAVRARIRLAQATGTARELD